MIFFLRISSPFVRHILQLNLLCWTPSNEPQAEKNSPLISKRCILCARYNKTANFFQLIKRRIIQCQYLQEVFLDTFYNFFDTHTKSIRRCPCGRCNIFLLSWSTHLSFVSFAHRPRWTLVTSFMRKYPIKKDSEIFKKKRHTNKSQARHDRNILSTKKSARYVTFWFVFLALLTKHEKNPSKCLPKCSRVDFSPLFNLHFK